MKNKILRTIVYICLSVIFISGIFSEEYEQCYITIGLLISDLLIDINKTLKGKEDK